MRFKTVIAFDGVLSFTLLVSCEVPINYLRELRPKLLESFKYSWRVGLSSFSLVFNSDTAVVQVLLVVKSFVFLSYRATFLECFVSEGFELLSS